MSNFYAMRFIYIKCKFYVNPKRSNTLLILSLFGDLCRFDVDNDKIEDEFLFKLPIVFCLIFSRLCIDTFLLRCKSSDFIFIGRDVCIVIESYAIFRNEFD